MRRRLGWLFGISLFLLAGCYQRVASDEGFVISFQPWVPLLVALGGLALVPVGILLFARRHRFRGALIMIVGPLVAIGVAPGMYLDRVVLDEQGFYARHGFWWSPTIHRINYKDLRMIKLAVEQRTTRNGTDYNYFFDCVFKDGKTERVPLGDIMRESLPEIADEFRKHNVQVVLPPDMPG